MRNELDPRCVRRRTARAAWQAGTGVGALLAVAWVAGACSDKSVVDPPAAAIASEATPSAMAMARASDRDILVAFYEATDGPHWGSHSENWLTDKPLREWYGVETDASGRVIELKLTGFYDHDRGDIVLPLAGPIPSALGGLNKLRRLNLRVNRLRGSIPSELANLASLEELNLQANDLTGPIPPELGQLGSLEELDLSSNDLTGPIPPELGNLGNLSVLDLGWNNFTGVMPTDLVRLNRLRYLDFADNPYANEDPELCAPGTSDFVAWLRGMEYSTGPYCNERDVAALTRLHQTAGGPHWTNRRGWTETPALAEWYGVKADSVGRVLELDLVRNGLEGVLPANLGGMTRMTSLRLSDNALSGRLPSSLFSTPLQELRYANTTLCAAAESWFQEWLGRLPRHEGTGVTCPPLTDREILASLYWATDGSNWRNSDNWLTDAPLGKWHGVETDEDGKVVELFLFANGLRGPIPPDLGGLAAIERLWLPANGITSVSPALGDLATLEVLWLNENRITSVPPELGNLQGLRELFLAYNRLASLPPELGHLANLETLHLYNNRLVSIPPELGNLGELRDLDLERNQLASVPPELGNLANLETLWLNNNRLASVPPELGRLANLGALWLNNNRLASVPPELGRLFNLWFLDLGSNELVAVPPRFGELESLYELHVDGNRLKALPSALQRARNLAVVDLSANELEGSFPSALVGLTRLTSLGLAHNAGLEGALPLDLTRLEGLESLSTMGTGLCAPADPEFLDWLEGVTRQRVVPCHRGGGGAAYLVQAVQSFDFPVPLVAGEPALLRVFVTAARETDAGMPPVRATFHRDGAVIHEVHIPATSGPIPAAIDEGSLAKSANVEIPGWVIQPGIEVVIEPDPDGTLDPTLGVARRLPPTGRMAVDVRAAPVLELTFVPFIWDESPDSSIVGITAAMAADPEGHELLEETRLLLPVAELDVTAHPAVASSTNDIFSLLELTEMIRVIEGRRGHYVGVMAGPTEGGFGGVAYDIGSWSNFSTLSSSLIAHELGHNRNLYHAPCGGAGGPDPFYPYEEGNIGAWGYDFRTGRLVRPETADYMSYCDPEWTSDYQFTNAFRYRIKTETGSVVVAADARPAATARSLLLWGGLDGEGAPYLRPAFLTDAPPALPSAEGAWSATGRDPSGALLFSLSFDMAEFTDTEDERAGFTFTMPVTWTGELADITLEGPGGSASLDRGTDDPLTIFRDPATGRIRGVLDGVSGTATPGTAAAVAADAQDLEVLFSRGIPNRENER